MSAIDYPTFDIATPRRAYVTFNGIRKQVPANLLGAGDSNTKLRKSSGTEFVTLGFSMLPHTLGGVGNVCPMAGACAASCLNSTGMGAIFTSVQTGRLIRRALWHLERDWLLDKLNSEIDRAKTKAEKIGKRLAVRLNVFSDIPWEKYGIIDNHSDVEFYDYSKNYNRVGQVRENYWVTYSVSEAAGSLNRALGFAAMGINSAIVFHNPGRYVGNRSGLQTLPTSFHGVPVHSAEETDLRFTDERGTFQGLKLKAANTANRQAAIDSGFSHEFVPPARIGSKAIRAAAMAAIS